MAQNQVAPFLRTTTTYLAVLAWQTRRLLSATVLVHSNWKVASDELRVFMCAFGVWQTLPLHQVLSIACSAGYIISYIHTHHYTHTAQQNSI